MGASRKFGILTPPHSDDESVATSAKKRAKPEPTASFYEYALLSPSAALAEMRSSPAYYLNMGMASEGVGSCSNADGAAKHLPSSVREYRPIPVFVTAKRASAPHPAPFQAVSIYIPRPVFVPSSRPSCPGSLASLEALNGAIAAEIREAERTAILTMTSQFPLILAVADAHSADRKVQDSRLCLQAVASSPKFANVAPPKSTSLAIAPMRGANWPVHFEEAWEVTLA
ncbi:hypothetical protein BC830DRAFT_1109201 [Chytriomyces sp. MP71]|nr:hypothetical protein BC830DRAFT_1109201 [Chytriomyces sp. MP71]